MVSQASIGKKRPSISSKTTCSSIPKIIKCKQCLKALKDAKDYKIIYISGKAGLGKTTPALSWLKETRVKPVWLTNDSGKYNHGGQNLYHV